MAAPNNPPIPPNPPNHPIPYVNCGRRNGPTRRSPECAICTEAFEADDPVIVHLNCENAWHTACLDEWVRTPGPSHCPTCRPGHEAIAPFVPPQVAPPPEAIPLRPPVFIPGAVEDVLQGMRRNIEARIVQVEREIIYLTWQLQEVVNEHRRFRPQLERIDIDLALRENTLEYTWRLSLDMGRLRAAIRQRRDEVEALILDIAPGPRDGAGIPWAILG